MLKVAVIGVMGALLALLLKGEKAGQSLWVVLAACLLIMGISLSKLENILTMDQGSGGGAWKWSVISAGFAQNDRDFLYCRIWCRNM